jgi:hypothetical protein
MSYDVFLFHLNRKGSITYKRYSLLPYSTLIEDYGNTENCTRLPHSTLIEDSGNSEISRYSTIVEVLQSRIIVLNLFHHSQ